MISKNGESMPHAKGGESPLGVIKIIVATLCGLLVLHTLFWEFHHYFQTPYYDDLFDRIRYYKAHGSTGALLSYLISPHNEHRIATTRILAILDERLFSGREHTQVVVANGLQLLLAAVVYRFVFEFYLGKTWAVSDKLLAFGAICLFFIHPSYLYTLIVPFQVQHVIMASLAVTVACLMMRASTDTQPLDFGRLVAALIFLAVVGSFTLGNSPMLLIAATAVAVVLRWPVRRVAILGVCALVHLAVVIKTTVPAGHVAHPLGDTLRCFFVYLGAPFLRFEYWPVGAVTWAWSPQLAEGLGLAVFSVGLIYGVARLLRPGFGGAVGVFGLTMLAMVVVTAAAAAYARAQFGPFEGASKKYASFAVLGWLGAMAVISGSWREFRMTAGLPSVTPIGVAAVVVLLFSIQPWYNEFRIWESWINTVDEASTALFTRANVKSALQAIYTDPDEVARYVDWIEAPGRGVFSHYPFRYGDNADLMLAGRREVGCRGEVQTLDPVKSDDLLTSFKAPGSPVSMSGWTWMADTRTPPDEVIAIDSKRRIVGVARVTRKSIQIERWLGQSFDGDWGWFGYGRIQDGAPVSEFIAIGSGGHAYCRLGGVGTVTNSSDRPRPVLLQRLVWRLLPTHGARSVPSAGRPTAAPAPAGASSGPAAVFTAVPPKHGNSVAKACDGNIDEINGKPPSPGEAVISSLNIKGWLAMDAKQGVRPDAVFLTLKRGDGTLLFAAAAPMERQDVVDHYAKPSLKMSGYGLLASPPPKGDYILGLAAVLGNDLVRCTNMDVPISVRF